MASAELRESSDGGVQDFYDARAQEPDATSVEDVLDGDVDLVDEGGLLHDTADLAHGFQSETNDEVGVDIGLGQVLEEVMILLKQLIFWKTNGSI